MKVEVSIGELLDKLSILEIKSLRIEEVDKLDNITKELETLNPSYIELIEEFGHPLKDLFLKLSEVNQELWFMEDAIRACEQSKKFNDEFITIARSVYIENDKRAAIKKQINKLTGSMLVEEKSYKSYE